MAKKENAKRNSPLFMKMCDTSFKINAIAVLLLTSYAFYAVIVPALKGVMALHLTGNEKKTTLDATLFSSLMLLPPIISIGLSFSLDMHKFLVPMMVANVFLVTAITIVIIYKFTHVVRP